MNDQNVLVSSVTYLETDEITNAVIAIAKLIDTRGPPYPDDIKLLRLQRTRRKVTPSELRRHAVKKFVMFLAESDEAIASLPAVKKMLAATYYKDTE